MPAIVILSRTFFLLNMNIVLTAAPESYPVTLTEVKAHLRITASTSDTLLTDLITKGTAWIETLCNNRFVEQTWTGYLDAFPVESYIELPFGMVKSVTSVKYTDYEGTQSTFSSSYYSVDTVASPGKIDLAYNAEWPTDALQPVNGVEIIWVTGYSSTPECIKQAILLAITHFFENPEPFVISEYRQGSVIEMPMAIDALITEYRMDPSV